MPDGPEFVLTTHAKARAIDMGITYAEIEAAFRRPSKTWPDGKYRTEMRCLGRVTLSLRMGGDVPVVLTMLWASDDLWRESYAKRPVGDRPPRF